MAVFTDRDGMVWRARIIAGMGESCHDGSDSLKMIRNLVAAVEGQSLTNDEINMLEGALQSDDTVTIEKAGYRLNASGSCVDIVTATAT